MDFPARFTYLSFAMLRQLLTLLAVISGFTLVAEPVSATDLREISAAATAAQDLADCRPVVAAPLQLAQARQRDRVDTRRCQRRIVVITPAVQLQADRAHE
ncbi:hypothetical protein GRI62_05190 [Erythrobacter arachoides]|uniref:UrcA family protein n=1 Tax=Aurantiacibacter arachoides TaxID=1850444 RepID=A0A845A622_9SPHN|nr:hypothetical protein [Aurantiacibacter arachoides]MXO92999.1 hypothetical protein [Aurantiacibacter arachoides]GGD52796.1 hypothetical protein GCM10011411_10870 [Aurantiacibacter arachoides]